MKTALLLVACLVSAVVVTQTWSAPPGRKRFNPNETAAKWVGRIDASIADVSAEEIETTTKAVLEELGASPVTAGLRESETLEAKRAALAAIREQLAFRPIKEGEMPEEFPEYTPPGLVEVKTYPTYRKAVAKQFFTLFRHITNNDIAMTVPVEMDLAESNGRLARESMAFLYGKKSLGSTGKQGDVNVVDVEPRQVVAIGVRGRLTSDVRQRSKQALEVWLADHPEFEADGDPRQLSYNSPFVPRTEQFHEVQLPVKRRGGVR